MNNSANTNLLTHIHIDISSCDRRRVQALRSGARTDYALSQWNGVAWYIVRSGQVSRVYHINYLTRLMTTRRKSNQFAPLEVIRRIRIHPSAGGGSHDFFFAADCNLGKTILFRKSPKKSLKNEQKKKNGKYFSWTAKWWRTKMISEVFWLFLYCRQKLHRNPFVGIDFVLMNMTMHRTSSG